MLIDSRIHSAVIVATFLCVALPSWADADDPICEGVDNEYSLSGKYPDHPRWALLVYCTALNYESQGKIGTAISVLRILIDNKPNHPLAKKSLYKVATHYERLAWFRRGARPVP